MKWTLFNIWITLIRKGTIADMSHKRRITCAPTSSLLLLITCCSCLPLSLMSPQMANSTSKWIASMLKKKHTVCVSISYISHQDELQKHTYSCISTSVQQKIGSVRCRWRLIGNWPMTQCHAHNSSHVSLCAENMDRNSCSLSCCNEKGNKKMQRLLMYCGV